MRKARGKTEGKTTSRFDAKTLQGMARVAAKFDAWQNIATKLGVQGKDARLEGNFVGRAPRSQQEIERLYEQDDIFPIAVDRIPEHGTRRWIRITGATTKTGRPDLDFSRALFEELESHDAQFKIFDLWRMHRLSGGSGLLLGVEDGRKPSEPLDLARVRKLKTLNVLSRWELFAGEIDRDPYSENYDQPLWYTTINSAERIHYSRVIRLPRHMIASRRSHFAIQGWDVPIVERVYDPIRQFGTLLGYIEAMFQDLVQGVLEMDGLAAALSADDGDEILIRRMQMISFARSMFNMVLVDKDEKYDRRNQAPTGLSDLVVRAMDRLAAATGMPLSILFGQPPTGLSTDDESGRRSFYDSVATQQRRLLRKPITILCEVLLAATEGPFKGKSPDSWSFDFLPLEEPNQNDDAQRRDLESQTEERLIGLGLLDRSEVRSKYANDPQSPYQINHGLDDALQEIEVERLRDSKKQPDAKREATMSPSAVTTEEQDENDAGEEENDEVDEA